MGICQGLNAKHPDTATVRIAGFIRQRILMPTLNTLTLDDLKAVLAVQSACYPPFFHESAAAFRAKLEASPDTHWLCRREGTALGYLVTLPVAEGKLPALDADAVATVDTPEWLYVHDLAVLPEARSLGLGKRFMAEAERVAREKGLRGLALVAVEAAEGYWANLGFQPVKTVSVELAAKLASFGEGAVYMEKWLG